jgi:hypothetical protein
MNAWLYRILAVVLVAAAIYLAVLQVHAARLELEAALAAALASIVTVALLWRSPKFAALLNACWIVAAFVAGFALTANRPALVSQTDTAQPPGGVSAGLERAVASAVPADYVLGARERELGTIDAAFAFVRDEIGFESYDGIFRGPDGTFHARAGNALDRAMLLAAILQSNKIPVRLVTGQLPQPQAERLFASMFEPAASPARSPQPGTLTGRIFDRAHRDYDAVLAALGNRPPDASVPSHDDVVKEIERHAWVQAQRNGQWLDLDPSFPDSTVGRTYASVQQSFDGPPAPLMQQVTIRVIAETVQGGALAQTVSLEKTLPAYELVDKPVYLLHEVYRPFNGQGGDLQFVFGNKDTQEPVLYVDGHRTVGQPIDFGSGASAAGTAPPNAAQAAADAFGTPAPGPVNPNAKAFVAEWLEFEIAYPDGRKELTRRPLMDRAGTAWRNAARHDPSALRDLPRNADGLIAPQNVHNIWFSAGKHDLLSFAAAALDLSTGTPARDPRAPTFLEMMWPFAIRDMSWFILSDHVVVPAVNDAPGVRLYADSPRIFIWSVGPDPAKPGDLIVTSDLRRDALRGVARDATLANVVGQRKLWFAALEGALEHEMSAPPNDAPDASLVTTSSLTETGDLVALAPGSPVAAGDPETQARLQSALAGGDTLVVPKRVLGGGIAGWWQVAHDTGDVRAVLDQLNGGMLGPLPPPKGPGINHIPNPDSPFYKRAFENPQAVCDELGALPAAGESGETRATSGNVCKPSMPAWKVAAISVEVAVLLAACYEAWQAGSN